MDTNRMNPGDAFPFPEYRDYQRAALYEASYSLFDAPAIDTVILNLPTGIGKSPINVALARQAESAFITTPQKALRTQLEFDDTLSEYYAVLRGRKDYRCPVKSSPTREYDCKNCPINRSDEESCIHQDACTYWNRKEDAMAAHSAVLTFSYLIVDGFLPDVNENNTRISFSNRELLVVDECHKLEDQVASLHAGMSVSPYSLPDDVFGQADIQVGDLPEDEVTKLEDVMGVLDEVYRKARRYVGISDNSEEASRDERQCTNFCRKYDYCKDQVRKGRDWVVGREEITYRGADRHSINVKPVDVDEFLQEHIWSRSKLRVLSTATMPFSGNPDRWVRRLGLNPETTRVIQYPMPFPREHRLIHTDCAIAKMSSGGFKNHYDEVVDALRELADQHRGEKGLIHTASYPRARDLSRHFPDTSICHEKSGDEDLRTQINEWRETDRDMFFSPAATDGVDLPYDDCRWQVLVKVPYPKPSDPRVRFLLDERKAWNWYYEVTCQDVQQSVGRGVRDTDDKCSYYVLDASFFDVLNRASAPEWFKDAIVPGLT